MVETVETPRVSRVTPENVSAPTKKRKVEDQRPIERVSCQFKGDGSGSHMVPGSLGVTFMGPSGPVASVQNLGVQNDEDDLQKQQEFLRQAVSSDSKVRYAETPEELELAHQFYDYDYLLGHEDEHCRSFPLYYKYEMELSQYFCLLCSNRVTQQHLNTDKHRKRFEWPTYYGLPRDRRMPLPRTEEDREIHRRALQMQSTKKEKTNFSTLKKKAALGRRLRDEHISMEQFRADLPDGAAAKPREIQHGQGIHYGELCVLQKQDSHYHDFPGSACITTDFDEEHHTYTVSLFGSFAGYHIHNVWETSLKLICDLDTWMSCYAKDEKLHDDIVSLQLSSAWSPRTPLAQCGPYPVRGPLHRTGTAGHYDMTRKD